MKLCSDQNRAGPGDSSQDRAWLHYSPGSCHHRLWICWRIQAKHQRVDHSTGPLRDVVLLHGLPGFCRIRLHQFYWNLHQENENEWSRESDDTETDDKVEILVGLTPITRSIVASSNWHKGSKLKDQYLDLINMSQTQICHNCHISTKSTLCWWWTVVDHCTPLVIYIPSTTDYISCCDFINYDNSGL